MRKKTKKQKDEPGKNHLRLYKYIEQNTDSDISMMQQLLYLELCDIEKKVIDNLKKDTDLQ